MKYIRGTAGVFSCVFFVSLLLFVISISSNEAGKMINTQICSKIRTILSDITSIAPFSVFEILVLLSPLFIFLALKYIARGKADCTRRFYRVLSVLSLFVSLYILTLGISYRAPSIFLKYAQPVSEVDLISAANTLKEAVNTESEFITDEPTFDNISDKAAQAFIAASEKHGLAAGKLPKPKPLISSRLVSYTGSLAIYSFPTAEININVNAPTYTIPFTVLHELGHSCGAVSETDANFIAYLASLESDSHFLRYSVGLSVLEYMLGDLRRVDYGAYLGCLEGLSERARADINSWHKYSQKYHSSIIFRAFDSSNTRHLKRWDKNGAAAYSAVSVYVTNYLHLA